MGLNPIATMPDYVKMLRQSPTEVLALADDLLIHVTGFFRDREAWDVLGEKVITPLIAQREEEATIRCWGTACSSGEEAYTMAILLTEAAEKLSKRFDVKIFATDMAERSLQHARAGIYPGGIEREIDPIRLERFFEKDDAFYSRLLESARASVSVSPSAALALERIRKQPFDLLVSDIGLPGMDGLMLLKEVRRTEKQTGRHCPRSR